MGPGIAPVIRFGRYRLHPIEGLARGAREIHVTQKALGVLRLLAERPGHLVTKDEIFERVWEGVAVSDAALTSCIQELRRALDEDARAPRFIETLHRRGFRFLPQTSAADEGGAPVLRDQGAGAPPVFVGRDRALAELTAALATVRGGTRQLVVVEGEAGIGKTTLIEAFLPRCRVDGLAFVARAACTEQEGPAEPYRPLFDALMAMSRAPGSERLLAPLRRCAPTWLAHMPSLHAGGERERLEQRAAGVTRSRMLRELTDLLDALGDERPVVLWLDDLHWADGPTLDWVAACTRGREQARTLLIVSLRPHGANRAEQVVTEARLKRWCRPIRLGGLDRQATRDLVGARLGPRASDAAQVADRVHALTEGHPLFITAMLDELEAEDGGHLHREADAIVRALDRRGPLVPDRLRALIDLQIGRLTADQRELLEVCSLMPDLEWSSAAAAAGANRPLNEIEPALSALASRGAFVTRAGGMTWPDGTTAEGFAFRHAMHREVLRARVTAAHRGDTHGRIAVRMEEAFRGDTTVVSGQLGIHFEAASDWRRAAHYVGEAAATASRRGAVEEGAHGLSRALELLARLPPSPERMAEEAGLRMTLGATLMAARGWGAEEVAQEYERVTALCGPEGAVCQRFPAQWGLWLFRWGRGELPVARELTRTLEALAAQSPDPMLQLQVDHAQWATAFCQGQFAEALAHAERGSAECTEALARAGTMQYGNHHPGVCARSFAARALAVQGCSSAAMRAAAEGVAEARRFEHPFTLALALVFAAATHQTLRDVPAVIGLAEEAAAISGRHGFALVGAWAAALLGWASALLGDDMAGAAVRVDRAVAAALATGSGQFRTFHLALLAEAQQLAGEPVAALATIEEARTWVHRGGERGHEAELHRLAGVALSAFPDDRAAAAAFEQGCAAAMAQRAYLFALRNAMALARVRLAGGQGDEERQLVHQAAALVADAPASDLDEMRRLDGQI